MTIPKSASRKNSNEVNCRAMAEIIGERSTTNIIPINVPIADAVVVSPRARPACPLQASGYPSKAVAAEAAVPGIFTRIAV